MLAPASKMVTGNPGLAWIRSRITSSGRPPRVEEEDEALAVVHEVRRGPVLPRPGRREHLSRKGPRCLGIRVSSVAR